MHSWPSRSWIIGILSIGWSVLTMAQQATVHGQVKDSRTSAPVELVTIYIQGTQKVTETDGRGNYSLDIPADTVITLVFTRLGYEDSKRQIGPFVSGRRVRVDANMMPTDQEIEIEVKANQIQNAGTVRQDVDVLKTLPTTTGNLESVLPHIALGTSSGSGGELTSQYSVRGGNYDENLVYVNDFEIYRPQLIRAGQQEGLSFPNIDLIRDLQFSSGGFQAKYGDKLSSVLDISYKRPDSTHYSVGASLLGGSFHCEGSKVLGDDNYRRFRYLLGARYKDTRYILGSLDLSGEYTPNFADVQGYFTYDLNRNWQLGYLTNYNRSEFQFRPVERSTATGLIDFALRLFAVFEGRERDRFTTTMNGLSLTYLPERDVNPLFLKFLASHQSSREVETIDIEGAYRLGVIETDLGADDAGKELLTLGTGIQHQYVRDYLESDIYTLQHKGGIEYGTGGNTQFIQWGVSAQYEDIADRINEWERLDSAGFSLPYDPEAVQVDYNLKSANSLMSSRFSTFVQNTWSRESTRAESQLTYGARLSFWTLNNELLFSPRVQWLVKPLQWDRNISFRLAAGIYDQPAFYRELRRPDGTLNRDIRAQKSAHLLAGWTWDFEIGKKNPTPIRFISEIYYKKLWDLIFYDIDNVRIRYYGENEGKGYVMGWDMRFNGEFVSGAESWINLSFLRAREQIDGITHLERKVGSSEGTPVKDVPRPTDRLVQASIFFQDYLPRNENFKVHLNLTVGTGLPYGLKDNNRIYRNTYRFPLYQRADIGFSFLLWNASWRDRKPNHWLRFTDNTWLSIEVFNLMGQQNVASQTWIKSIYNVQYSIPNYLTSRRVNLRVKMDF